MAATASQFRIAVDASWLHDGGIGRMAQEILVRRPANVDIVEMRGERSNAGLLTPIDLALKGRAVCADAIWSPGFMPPIFRVPGKRYYVTIHDLAHLHHYSRKHRIYYNLLIRRLLANVDGIFTVSDYTRNEIIRWAGIDAHRVVRIYNGVSAAFQRYGPPSESDAPYILYVGNRRSYKNIDRTIAAFARSGLVAKGYRLWLTGNYDEASSASAVREGVGDRLRYLGRVSDADLAAAYRGARALAFLSLYEGFGLPIVEAMACACPVLASNTTALAEIAGDAALTVDPLSTDAIAAGLARLCLDDALRAKLRAVGPKKAALFTWDQCAARYWQVLTQSRLDDDSGLH